MKSNEELYDEAMEFYEDSNYFDAMPLLKSAVDAGHLPSAEKLANCYNRTGQPEKAIPYWEICRKAGNHSANTNYAGYLQGHTDQQDLAMQLWKEAADAGNPQAAFNLGVWYKNLNRIEEATELLLKAGDLGFLDGYFVRAGIFYRAEQWAQAREALAPLLAVKDERAETMLLSITMNDGGDNPAFTPVYESDGDFDWNDYEWNWKTPDNVREFVDLVLENHEEYNYAYGSLSDLGDENFFFHWWSSVQEAIEDMARTFNRSQIEESIEHLLAPNGYYEECDPAIFDALLKYVPGFPIDYPQFSEAIELFLNPEEFDYTSDWWDFSWYPFEGAEFTWTFWGPETMARSTTIDPAFLTTIFKLSFISETPYKSFRARVALATNKSSPKEILDFLFNNKDSNDWLINNSDEGSVILFQDGRYLIDEDFDSIETLRDDAASVATFRYPTDNQWRSGPGAHYVENLLDIEWAADDAHTCLLAAFAKNPGLSAEQYEELATVQHPLVRYFLSVNQSLPASVKAALEAEKPTFTYQPYGSHPTVDPELLKDVWVDLR